MRLWNEFVAALADLVGGIPMLVFLTILAAGLTSLALYFWPHWLPWNWRFGKGSDRTSRRRSDHGDRARRFRMFALKWRWRMRWRWRRRRRRRSEAVDLPPDELPDLPAEVLAITADQLAAAGRYAEAVRERLRSIVRDLIEREVIPHTPGWTVTELASAASVVRPAISPPLRSAVDVFSMIWYGLRPATQVDDNAMRTHAAAVTQVLAQPTETAVSVGGGGR